ncbi:hypothetical protein OZN62_11915 [Aurantiacibacter sp. MUD11]|uniref:hypothetical protein n=1 Tax=Aurantiacibacter sp. MUD11 TaxID=3003265 RepID=UPI0022AB1163|nr:hypothetical protein [Aurantiacibacter sp. MUD11]WAT17611.1 hypothetical protein OZN62_11915 [Aurantiacibacter sp. MUD11]
MTTRRDILKWGAVLPALGTGWHGAFAAVPQGLDALVLDTRFPGSQDLANAPVPVWRFAGDVTPLWTGHLAARWRERGHVLGGITGSDALFVLEMLAEHRGRRVVSRTALDLPRVNGVQAYRWIIAPHHPSVTA